MNSLPCKSNDIIYACIYIPNAIKHVLTLKLSSACNIIPKTSEKNRTSLVGSRMSGGQIACSPGWVQSGIVWRYERRLVYFVVSE